MIWLFIFSIFAMLLRMLVLLKILIRHSICDETKRINRNSSLFGNCRMFWPRFIDLQNFILLVRTVPFFSRIIFISSYTEKNNYFLLYELIQDLPYVQAACDTEGNSISLCVCSFLEHNSDPSMKSTSRSPI